MDDVHFVSMVCELDSCSCCWRAERKGLLRAGWYNSAKTLDGDLTFTRIMGTEQWWFDIFSSHGEYSNTCTGIHKLCKIQQGMWLVEKLEEMEYCLLLRMVVNQIRAYS